MENIVINLEKLRNINNKETFVCLFSGGKDCGLALSLACKKGIPVSLIHCMDKDISSNHKQEIDIIRKQAFAMDIPVSIINCDMRERTYIYHLTKQLKRFGLDNVSNLVTGTIYDIHAYKIYTKMCSNASMQLKCPLWGYSNEEILKLLGSNNIKSMITTINDDRIPYSWLGKIYDANTYKEFESLGIHPFGEYDEFHTTLIDADFFKKKLIVKPKNKTKTQLDLDIYIQ